MVHAAFVYRLYPRVSPLLTRVRLAYVPLEPCDSVTVRSRTAEPQLMVTVPVVFTSAPLNTSYEPNATDVVEMVQAFPACAAAFGAKISTSASATGTTTATRNAVMASSCSGGCPGSAPHWRCRARR